MLYYGCEIVILGQACGFFSRGFRIPARPHGCFLSLRRRPCYEAFFQEMVPVSFFPFGCMPARFPVDLLRFDGNSGGDSVSGEPSSTAVPSQTETAATTTATLPTQRDVSGEQTQTVGSVLVVEIPAMNTTTSCVRRRISTPPWSAGRGRACRASARYMPWWSPPVSISSCRTVCAVPEPALFRPGGGDPLYVRLYERRHDGRPVRRCNPTGMNTCTSVPTTTGPLWGPINTGYAQFAGAKGVEPVALDRYTVKGIPLVSWEPFS